MDRLSSCYFCGAALDAQLSEYPVVPRRLQSEGGERKTVVLCDGCRHKLGTVLEEVVTATEGESTAAPEHEEGKVEPVDAAANGGATEGQTLLGETDDDTDQRADGRDAASTTGTESGADGEREADGSPDDQERPSLTKLEYNKVMRLLQNREFPVDRLEIREVATSAYRIDPEEFDAVIDAAIERGLIAEEDGQFVEAEGR